MGVCSKVSTIPLMKSDLQIDGVVEQGEDGTMCVMRQRKLHATVEWMAAAMTTMEEMMKTKCYQQQHKKPSTIVHFVADTFNLFFTTFNSHLFSICTNINTTCCTVTLANFPSAIHEAFFSC